MTIWRYEIKHGPEGEANYAWVYKGNDMIATMKTHHAIEVVKALSASPAGVEPLTKTQIETLANNIHNVNHYDYTIECLTHHLSARIMSAIEPAGVGVETTPPSSHVAGFDLPADIIESLLAIGPVEWGVSLTQTDEKHASDLLDTLRITREHFGVTDEETGIHGVYLEGTGTVLAHTGMSPNSPQHARILVGAWNQLVEIAKAKAATTEGSTE